MVKKSLLAGLAGVILVTSGVLFGPGASPQAHATLAMKKHYKIVLIAGIASDAFYITMNHGAQAEARREGATVQFSGSSAGWGPSYQIPFLNAAIARKPDLILIAPTDKVAMQ